ncbi:MAG TPA: hypothetical protein VIH72_11835 [Candidatus Acidoferrales bacterium]|jgi:hypothetical protein
MRGSSQPELPRQKVNRVEVYWTAVTYKTVMIYCVLALALAIGVIYLMNPAWVDKVIGRVEQKFAGSEADAGPLTPGQVRFVSSNGSVQVKKMNSVTWTNAEPGNTLDKGDLIRTGGDGLARLSFPDGTTYTVKADTFVTVEENSVAKDKSTNVAVHISSGAVDLTTPAWDSPRSTAGVSFADARASMKENSRAAVHSDGKTNEGDITLMAGGADVKTPTGSVSLNKWEKAAVAPGAGIVKSNVLAPPDLVAPLNMQPLIEPDPKQAKISFEWKPIPEAVDYVLKISSNAAFNSVAKEQHVTGTSTEVTGLDPGEYFWNVIAVGPGKKESEASDTYKFTVVAQGKGGDMLLVVDETVLHGSVVEIIGHTEPSAALIINGNNVAGIKPDGHFSYFTEPLSKGSHTIMVTGQNRRGGMKNFPIQIVIP